MTPRKTALRTSWKWVTAFKTLTSIILISLKVTLREKELLLKRFSVARLNQRGRNLRKTSSLVWSPRKSLELKADSIATRRVTRKIIIIESVK